MDKIKNLEIAQSANKGKLIEIDSKIEVLESDVLSTDSILTNVLERLDKLELHVKNILDGEGEINTAIKELMEKTHTHAIIK